MLQYKVQKQVLQRATAETYRTAGRNIPATTVARISAGRDALELRSTDLSLWRSERIQAERIDGRGTAALNVDARSLRDVVRAQPGKVLSLEISADSLAVGGVPVAVSTYPEEDLPTWPELEGESVEGLALDWPSFLGAAGRVAPAISKEESRFQLSAAHLRRSDDGLELAATDGHRLHMAACAQRGDSDVDLGAGVLIPLEVVQDVLRPGLRPLTHDLRPVLRVGGAVHVQLRATTAAGLGVVWTWRKVEGTFPDVSYLRKINPLDKMAGADVDCSAWDAALAALMPTVPEKSPHVRAVLTGAGTELAAGTDYAARFDLAARWKGCDVALGLNPRYLRDLFKVAGDTLRLHVKDADSALIGTAEGGFYAMLMPIRLDRDVSDELVEKIKERLATVAKPSSSKPGHTGPAPKVKVSKPRPGSVEAVDRELLERYQDGTPEEQARDGREIARRIKAGAWTQGSAAENRPAGPVAVEGEAGKVLSWALGEGYAAEMRGAWVWIRFEGKPSEATRDGLKAHHCRWAKRRSLAQRCSFWYYAPPRQAPAAQVAAAA